MLFLKDLCSVLAVNPASSSLVWGSFFGFVSFFRLFGIFWWVYIFFFLVGVFVLVCFVFVLFCLILICVCLFAYGDFKTVNVRTVFSVDYRNIESQNRLD